MTTEVDVRRAAMAMPEVTERLSYGTPAWFVGKLLFARITDHDGALAVRVADEQDKHALIAEDPAVFWTIPHYDGYAMVLVRLGEVSAARLDELLHDAWLSRATPTIRRRHPDL